MTDATATSNGELHTEDDALSVLMDGDIDKVMSGLDRIVEAAPRGEGPPSSTTATSATIATSPPARAWPARYVWAPASTSARAPLSARESPSATMP